MSNISFCFVGDRAFFLDRRRDRYFCLSSKRSALLARSLSSPDEAKRVWSLNFADLLALCDIRELPRHCGALELTSDVVEFLARGSIAITSSLAWRYFRAWRSLKVRGFDATIRSLQYMKATRRIEAASYAQERALGAAVVQLGSLIPLAGHCLRTSVAMAHLMQSLRVDWSLAIGVKSGPFAAHAWVQSGSTVITCPAAEASLYHPILVI